LEMGCELGLLRHPGSVGEIARSSFFSTKRSSCGTKGWQFDEWERDSMRSVKTKGIPWLKQHRKQDWPPRVESTPVGTRAQLVIYSLFSYIDIAIHFFICLRFVFTNCTSTQSRGVNHRCEYNMGGISKTADVKTSTLNQNPSSDIWILDFPCRTKGKTSNFYIKRLSKAGMCMVCRHGSSGGTKHTYHQEMDSQSLMLNLSCINKPVDK